MSNQTYDESFLPLVAHHARTVRRGFTFPEGELPLVSEEEPLVVKACPVCCAPMDPKYSMCYRCQERAKAFKDELADIVVPLSYAVSGHRNLQQFYLDLHQYKSEIPSKPAQTRLEALMHLFRFHHQKCLETAVGQPISSVIAVPSGKNRPNHPLPKIAKILTVSLAGISAVPLLPARFVGQVREGRAGKTNPDDFSIDHQLSGHVVIVEDTWVQGHNAQGLAIRARRQGADKVSIVVMARMLDYNYNLTKIMVDSWANAECFDPCVCPVTGECH